MWLLLLVLFNFLRCTYNSVYGLNMCERQIQLTNTEKLMKLYGFLFRLGCPILGQLKPHGSQAACLLDSHLFWLLEPGIVPEERDWKQIWLLQIGVQTRPVLSDVPSMMILLPIIPCVLGGFLSGCTIYNLTPREPQHSFLVKDLRFQVCRC